MIDHESIWSKRSRILDKVITYKFLKSSFLINLKIYLEILLSLMKKARHGNNLWRLVRPNKSNDDGPYHRDSWFGI